MTDLSLTTKRTINAPAKKVFEAWLDPEMLAKFMIPGDGMSVPKVTTEPKTGGRFSIIMASGKNEIPHAGTYLEINPFSRIVFTWESPFSVEGSTVSLDFVPLDGGKTELTLVHVKFPDEESLNNHKSGWNRILDTLAKINF